MHPTNETRIVGAILYRELRFVAGDLANTLLEQCMPEYAAAKWSD